MTHFGDALCKKYFLFFYFFKIFIARGVQLDNGVHPRALNHIVRQMVLIYYSFTLANQISRPWPNGLNNLATADQNHLVSFMTYFGWSSRHTGLLSNLPYAMGTAWPPKDY